MPKKVAALFLIFVCTATWMGCAGTTSHYVYAALPGANEVGVYREDPNSGVLTQLSTSPYTAGNAAQSIAVHPSKKFMYVANTADNTISLFTIASNGGLTEVTPRTTAGSTPAILVMDAAGAYLYEANRGLPGSISVFSIDSSSGALTQIPNSPFGVGISPLNLKLNPAGNVLYVTGTGSPTGLIIAFTLTAGALSPIGSFSSGGASPYGLFADASGKYLYVANGSPDNSIAEFTIGSTGALTEISGSPIGQTNGVNPLSLLVDPSGKYLYVANEGSSNVSAYTIASGGSLTALATPTFSTGSQPSFLLADPNGKYLLVGNQSAGIQVFGLDPSTGDLTSITTFSTGSNPSSLAITQ